MNPLQRGRFAVMSTPTLKLLATVAALLLLPGGTRAAEAPSKLDQARAALQAVHPGNFDRGGPVSRTAHLNFAAFYPQATVARRGKVRELPWAESPVVEGLSWRGEPLSSQLAQDSTVDALIIVQRGRILFEAYPNQRPTDRHLSWSVSKVIVSAAAAQLVRAGRLDPTAQVDVLLPELADTEWSGVTVAQIANMASGIACLDSEGYQNSEGCIYRFEESLGITERKNAEKPTLEIVQSIERSRPPGERNEYASVNTHVLGWLIERTTDQPLWRALEDLVWAPMGAAHDGLIAIGPAGDAYASGGVSLRLRDLARFGVWQAEQGADLPAPPVAFAQDQLDAQAKRFGRDVPTHAGWQWDEIWPDGDRFKSGYSGQGLYVSPERELVVAFFGTHTVDGRWNKLEVFARTFARERFPIQDSD